MKTSMKAAFIKQIGSPDTIVFGDLPVPSVSDNEVLVKVTSSAVDWVDTHIRSGEIKVNLNFPFILGRDMCGTVEKVGSQVKEFKVGDRVWANSQGMNGRQGTYAEYVSVNQDFLHHLPKGVDEKKAVAVLYSGLTACYGLIAKAKLRIGETILVIGGAGNVGSALIQLAKARDCRVIATASSKEKADWCFSLGADHVIDHTKGDVEKEVLKIVPEGVNVHWDTTREPDFEKAVSVTAYDGRIIVMAGATAKPVLPVGPFYRKNMSLVGFTIDNISPEEMKNYADIVNKCLTNDRLKGKIAGTMPLSKVAEAHKLQEADKHIWGKIVLTV